MSEEQAQKETSIRGNKVIYSENEDDGRSFLENYLDSEEANVFFYYARNKGEARFRDGSGRRYALKYDSGNYTLNKL
jgi:hypothetical protein